jgi:uncharacterized protein (TIGR02217 family)
VTTLPVNPYITAVNVIPASGEFVYDTVAYSGKSPGASSFVPINTYFAPGGTKTDFSYALDQLQQILPTCGFVAIVVQWMGNSLDLSECQLYPSTTYWLGAAVGAFEPTAGGTDSWRVSDLTLADCNGGLIPISRPDGINASYGGTCSDQSVVRAIQAVKARGLKVCLYLQMNMDSTGQPWRGMCTYSPDNTSTATTVVNNFFGSSAPSQFTQDTTNLTVHYSGSRFDFTYSRFVLHYANLIVVAGGVNLFTIGSEMRGIEAIRGPAWTMAGTLDGGGHATWDYPAVAKLMTLIDQSRSIFDAAGLTKNLSSRLNLITYSADWSQWTGCQHAGISGIFPHMDPLYAMANCDLVSFDNYLPMSDWTTGGGGLDEKNWTTPVTTSWPTVAPLSLGIGLLSSPDIHDLGYLQFGLERGEKADYWYGNYDSTSPSLDPFGTGQYVTAPQGDRLTQSRNIYYTGQELFALKKFRWWWNNSHRAVYDAGDGNGLIPRGVATAWVPQSKSIMWQEYGFASIDRDTNEENLFYNPGNIAGGTPFWCNWKSVDGAKFSPIQDGLIQYNAHNAWYSYWLTGGNNPSVSGVPMIATDMMFAWNWDARPFPVFPLRLDVWGDGANWAAGMWLAGKGPALAIQPPDPAPSAGAYSTFPSLIGQEWSVHYKPRFSTTATQKVSGRESRAALMSAPLWDIELSFDRLRSDSLAELQTVIGFIAEQTGQVLPFLFSPPGSLGTVSNAVLGTGDGSSKSFTLFRTIGGYSEPVQAVSGSPSVYVSGALVSPSLYTVSIRPAIVTFITAPSSGAVVTASFSAAHLARLMEDQGDLEQITSSLWQMKSLKIETVRS